MAVDMKIAAINTQLVPTELLRSADHAVEQISVDQMLAALLQRFI